MSTVFLFISLLAFRLGNVAQIRAFSLEPMEWTEQHDINGGVRVSWVKDDPDWLTMEVQSLKQDGWVGVGFSPNGGMAGADMVIGWMDPVSGEGQIRDMYGVGEVAPIEDPSQDYELMGIESNEAGLAMRFRRKWNTCDKHHDYRIGNDTVKLIWAYGELGAAGGAPQYHGPIQRGIKHVYLKVQQKFIEYPDEEKLDELQIKYIDFRIGNIQVPTATTSYMCTMYKYPETDGKKHQLIGWKPMIEEQNLKNLHHFIVYECRVPKGERSFDKYEKDLGKVVGCYGDNMPIYWSNYCMMAPIVWGIGGEGEMFEPSVGLPMGEGHGGSTYFMFEAHYDNPEEREFMDNSGIRVYYTDQLRENDMGSLWIGNRFSAFQFLPPGAPNYHSYGGCTSECTAKTLPPEGIIATQVLLHMHNNGRKVYLRHIRNGVELEPIAVDENYDNDFQQTRPIQPGRRILPGDTILMDCQYNSAELEKPVYGGIDTNSSEMCLAILHYYPRIDLSHCQWQTEFTEFMNAFGVRRVEGAPLGVLKYPYKPTLKQRFDPPDEAIVLVNNGMGLNPLAGIKVKDQGPSRGKTVMDVVEGAPWRRGNGKLTKDVTRKFENGKHYAFCSREGRVRVPLRKYITRVPRYRKYHEPEDEACLKNH